MLLSQKNNSCTLCVPMFIFGWRDWMSDLSQRNEILEGRDDRVVTLLALEIHCYSTQRGHFCSFKSKKKLRPITWRINKVASGLRFETLEHRFVLHNVPDMRRPFTSRCFGTCHFCIKTSPHGGR